MLVNLYAQSPNEYLPVSNLNTLKKITWKRNDDKIVNFQCVILRAFNRFEFRNNLSHTWPT